MAKKKTSVILKAKQVQNLKNSIHIHLAPSQKKRNKRKKARVFRTPDVPPPINRIIHQDIVLPYNHGAIRPQGQSNALQSNQAEEFRKLYNDIQKDREPRPRTTYEAERENQDAQEGRFSVLNEFDDRGDFATPIKEVRAEDVQNMTPITQETKERLKELNKTRKTFNITEERGQKLINDLLAKLAKDNKKK
jgi:soluble cytochrome b562